MTKEAQIRRIVLIGLILLASVMLICTSCGEKSSTETYQLVATAEDLELQINNGMTLDQVYNAMTPDLKNQSIIYPAQNIIRQPDGKWQFTAKEGGSPGDTDAPFQVLLFYPSPIVDPYYMIFFDNEEVFHDAWFEYEAATSIQKLLWTTESTD